MDSKITAVGKLHQVEEKRRDDVGQQLENMRKKNQHMQHQMEMLNELKVHTGESAFRSPVHAGKRSGAPRGKTCMLIPPIDTAIYCSCVASADMKQQRPAQIGPKKTSTAASCSGWNPWVSSECKVSPMASVIEAAARVPPAAAMRGNTVTSTTIMMTSCKCNKSEPAVLFAHCWRSCCMASSMTCPILAWRLLPTQSSQE